MNKTINWGIIGLGKIAHKFVSDLQLIEDANLKAVASRSLEKSLKFGKKFNAENCYGNYEALVNDPEVDVVYIATPHSLHFENTLMCLENQKAVLCEKPLALNSDQVDEMISKAKKHKVFFMEALWTRFFPAFNKAIELVNNNEIGQVRYIQADFGFRANFDASSRLFNKKLGGGSLLDIGIYPIFLAYTFLGIPGKIKASANFSTTGVDETCSIIFEYKNGITANLFSSLTSHTPTKATICGDKGQIILPRRWHESPSVILSDYEKDLNQFHFEKAGIGYLYEIQEANRCLQNNQLESTVFSHKNSSELMGLIDRVKKEIGLVYD